MNRKYNINRLRRIVPSTFDSTALQDFEGSTQMEILLIQNEQENHPQTSHTSPSEPT